MITNLRSTLQGFQKDLFWLPAAFWGLFLLLILALFDGPEQVNAGQAFLGYVVPLLAGGLAAYSILEDTALELQFAMPGAAVRMLSTRLGLVAGIVAVCALSFQGALALAGIDLGTGLGVTQVIWAVPSLALMTTGTFVALWGRNSSAGGAFVGAVWLFELITRGWMITHVFWRHLLLFYASMAPSDPGLPANLASLSALSLVCLAGSVWLLRKQERYI